MNMEEEKKKLLDYLAARKMGGALATPVDSPAISKQTKIKSSVVARALTELRNEGLVTYSRTDGWRLR
jgi:DNA-binding IclR family transcriptional regulator